MEPLDEHIQPFRLFKASQKLVTVGFQLRDDELDHLRECAECRHVLEVFARQFDQDRQPHDKPGDAA